MPQKSGARAANVTTIIRRFVAAESEDLRRDLLGINNGSGLGERGESTRSGHCCEAKWSELTPILAGTVSASSDAELLGGVCVIAFSSIWSSVVDPAPQAITSI